MDTNKVKNDGWQKSRTNVFWGEIAPTDHLVQIYEKDEILLDSLEGFVSSGFLEGDSVIIIATESHINALNDRLQLLNFNLEKLKADHQYIPLEANEVLASFMKNGWPDETLFMETVKKILSLARGKQIEKQEHMEKWWLSYGLRDTMEQPCIWNTCGINFVRLKLSVYSVHILKQVLRRI